MQKVLHYRRRAEELMRLGDIGINPEAMERAQEPLTDETPDRSSGFCANGAGLLYVHAGIAMADAMLLFLTKNRSAAQYHNEAVSKLQKECGRRHRAADGIKHLQWLVKNKNFFAYDDKRVSLDDAKQAQAKIQRFLTWAFKSFPKIAENDWQ